MYMLGVIIIFHIISLSSAEIKWIAPPQHTVVMLGEDLMLDCSAIETEGQRLIFQWYYNDTTLPSTYSVFLNNSLFIPTVTNDNLGDYKCIVKTDTDQLISPTATVIAAFIDDFLSRPKSYRTIQGELLTFDCITGKSAPPSQIYWELNGQKFTKGLQLNSSYGDSDPTRLSNQFSMKLEIVADRLYSGTFRCISINPLSNQTVKSEEGTLFVGYRSSKPVVKSYFKPEMMVAENENITIDCEHEGYPKPTVWWFHNNILLDDTLRQFFYSNGSLTFRPVLVQDAGEYYCEVFNKMGRVRSNSTNITVTVLDISFKEEPSDSLVFAGQSKTLKCVPPRSIPPANITWYKDYKPLSLRTGDMALSIIGQSQGIWDLYFTSVQRQDEGIYFCVASNQFTTPSSRTSTTAFLSVEGAPVIIQPPSDTKIVKGRLLQLNCLIDSKPTATVNWLFQNLPLSISSKVTFSNNKQELSIGDIGKAEEGLYTCIANNSYGEKQASATIKIIVPPVRVSMLGNVVYKINQTAIIPCDIYGDPKPTATWYKDETIITNPQTNIANSLIISNIQITDEGNYSCHGVNEAGSAWTNGTLRVKVPPRIIQGPIERTVLIGLSTRLNCQVEGYPTPSIRWLLNGTAITDNYPGGVIFSPTNNYLDISIVTWQHVGVYTCIASSIEGTDQSVALLLLNVPVSINTILGNNIVLLQDEVNLRCSAYGIPIPTVIWKFKGEQLQATLDGRISFPSLFTIRVKFVTLQDAGLITCLASNSIGTSQKSLQLYVIDSPKPPILASVLPVSISSISLTWLEVTQPDYTNVTYYRIYYKQRVEENFKLLPDKLDSTLKDYEVTNLLPGIEYVFTIASQNDVGIGSRSNAISATTFESGPTEPRSLKVINIASRSLTLSWELPETTNGDIRKYQLHYLRKNGGIDDINVVDIFSPTIPTQVFTINSLHPYTLYEIKVRAGNIQNGQNIWGTYSLTLVVRTKVEVPSSSPLDVKALTLSSDSVLLQWKPLSEENTNGPILEYVILYNSTATNQSKLTLQSSELSKQIINLRPWTNYSFQMKVVNEAGSGPVSSPVFSQTYAKVPSSAPSNLQGEALSSDTIQVSWKAPVKSSWNSNITGYIIQYRLYNTTQWLQIVTDNTKTSVFLKNLSVWSKYEIHVAVYTLQVTPGIGPYSNIITVQTLETVPDSVSNIKSTTSNNSIELSWLPPDKSNGQILYYIIRYSSYNMTDMEEIRVEVNVTSYFIGGLKPDSQYNISIIIVNTAGYSVPINYTIYTLPANDDNNEDDDDDDFIDSITTNNILDISSYRQVSEDKDDGKSVKNLPVIVGGGLTAGIFVLFIIILIIYKCVKKRRSERENYVISSSFKSKRFSSLSERDEGINSTVNTQPRESYESQQSSSYSSRPSVIPQSQESYQYHCQIPGVVNESESIIVNHKSTNQLTRTGSFHGESINSGVDNPNYLEDEVFAATLPRPHSTPVMSSEELYAKMGERLKKNRMKSGSAAAIARLKNNSLSISTNDTDSLVNNDSVVIYNERTVL